MGVLRSDLSVMHIYCINTQNLSAAVNPSRLHPVELTYAHGHTLIETDVIHWSWCSGHWWTANGDLLKGTSAMVRTEFSPIFLSGESGN